MSHVEVSPAESAVAEPRSRFDATANLGVSVHVTVLFPFTSPDEIASDVLHDAQSALSVVQAFDFSVAKIGRCAATAYLSPDPLEPFVALTTALVKRFPMFRPYGGAHGGIVAHLTVAHADAATAASAAGELEQRLRAHQPIRTCCSSVTLLENSSGPWRTMRVLDLPSSINTKRI